MNAYVSPSVTLLSEMQGAFSLPPSRDALSPVKPVTRNSVPYRASTHKALFLRVMCRVGLSL